MEVKKGNPMKRTSLILASMLLAAAAALAQTEGVADYRITGESMKGTGRLTFSKAGYRADWNVDVSGDSARHGGKAPREMKMSMLGKAAEPDVVYTINDETKTYSSWSTKNAQDKQSTAKYTVEKLGADTVAGFACQNARIKSSQGADMEVCVTKDVAAPAGWLSAVNRDRGAGASWTKALRDAGVDGFPIRWVTKGDGHGGSVTMEMTKFERKSVPASTFEVPAGYQKSDPMSVGMSPEQKKQMDEALKNMTPEQRKQYEEMMKQHGQQPPRQ
jgi:hypothetical protein